MKLTPYCQFCGGPVDLGQEFVYQFETEKWDAAVPGGPVFRVMPEYHGEPLRICKECSASVAQNERDIALQRQEAKKCAKRRRRVWAGSSLGISLFVLVIWLLSKLAR
jgi:hypothetical protein